MDFTPVKAEALDRNICVQDITDFFVQFLKNDNLGFIADSHLCWADTQGVKSEKCKSSVAAPFEIS
jgi:RNA-dependent RNA polymerase